MQRHHSAPCISVRSRALAVAGFVMLGMLIAPLLRAETATSVLVTPLAPKASLFLAPRTATVVEGSTFSVPIFVNTDGTSINTIALSVSFDPTKLALVSPSDSNSVIGIWVTPPSYSNAAGTLGLAGVIPNGITTSSGLITTMTFRALAPGAAAVSISDSSQVLENDGQGTAAALSLDHGTYTILAQSPAGPQVFSNTHPLQDTWYNNPNPSFSWNKDPGVTDFAYTLDDKPFTVPGDTANATGTSVSYENLPDGVWYFHIKARTRGIWGGATHFAVHIDTAGPAAFTPVADVVSSGDGTEKALVSFFTTDSMSGIDHYEIAVADASATSSPVFVEATSPYQVPLPPFGRVRVTVRAFDRAGNVTDESITISAPLSFIAFLETNWLLILLLVFIVGHYFFGHRVVSKLKRVFRAVREEEAREGREERPLPPSAPAAPPAAENLSQFLARRKRDLAEQEARLEARAAMERERSAPSAPLPPAAPDPAALGSNLSSAQKQDIIGPNEPHETA